MSATPRFDVGLDDGDLGSRLLVALTSPGMAVLAAGDHLVSRLDAGQVVPSRGRPR